MNKKIFTVSQINKYAKDILEEDIILSDIFVEGEISNLKFHNLGYIYFTLKDNFASINCVIFSNLDISSSNLKEGSKVIIYGKINLYEKTGKYQLIVELIENFGKGNLHISLEELKNKLEEKGYFDKSNKKPIPSNPKTIALITSSTGAAVSDMIKIAKRRNKNISLAIIPTLVQGKDAPYSISNSINLVNKWNKADIIILGRGGGSKEDLEAFNSEIVADSIHNSSIPIISAVGHETDFTISDFVSDLRASTPSSAIEMSVPNINNIKYILNSNLRRINQIFYDKYNNNKEKLNNIYNNKIIYDFYKFILLEKKLHLKKIFKLLNKEINNNIEKENIKINNLILLLKNLSPDNLLKRGYSIVYKNNKNIKTIKDLEIKDSINIQLKDGIVKSKVCSFEYEKDKGKF